MSNTTDEDARTTSSVGDGGDDAAKVVRRASRAKKTAYALLVAAGLATVIGIAYAYWIGIHLGFARAQHIHATLEVKVEIALGHLWFEEILSGDRQEDMSEVWRHYERAEWYTRAMLDGDEDEVGRFIPLADPAMRRIVEESHQKLLAFKRATARRSRLHNTAVAGTDADREYDAAFKTMMAELTGIELRLQEKAASERTSFHWTLVALVFINAVLYVAGGAALRRSTAQRRRADRALAASEKNLQITLDSIGDAVIATDAEGLVTRMNPVAESLTGWSLAEARKRPLNEIFRIVNEETRAEVESPVAKVLREGTIVGLANHTLLIAKDGTERPIADSGAPIHRPDGGLLGVIMVFRDISKEYEISKALEATTHALGERVKELGCLYGISGLVEKEDTSLPDILQGTAEIIPPSWQYPEITCSRITLEGKTFQTAGFAETEWKQAADIRLKGKPVGSVEVFYSEERPDADEGPFLKEERALIEAIAERLGRVVELVRAEDALRRNEQSVTTTLNSIGDAVIATDVEGRITRMNPVAESLTGWPLSDARARPLDEIFNIVNEETRAKVESPVVKVLREGAVVGLANHTLLIAKDGTECPIADSGAPIIEEEGGEIRGVVLVFRDQTEERRAQMRIEHLNEILRAIRNVNQLITTEKDRDALLKGACECLTETRGFHRAWIAALDEKGKVVASSESGIGEDFSRLTELFETGKLPDCAERALAQAGVVTTEAAASACADCPLRESHTLGSAITSRLECAGTVYGVMSVSVPAESLSDKEELALAEELASDIALALHAISLEEERKLAEEALRTSEERFRQFFNNVPVYSYMVSPDGTVLDVNKAALRALGYEKDELVGKPLKIIYAPEAHAKMKRLLVKWKETDKLEDEEMDIVTKRGERRSVLLSAAVVRGPDGEIVSSISVQKDITDRKRAEEALRESEAQYRDLVEKSHDLVWQIDTEGRFTFLNTAWEATLGYALDEMIGHRFTEFKRPEEAERSLEAFRQAIDGEELHDFETVYLKKSGEEVWLSFNASRDEDAEGNVIGTRGTAHDITDRKRAAEVIAQLARFPSENPSPVLRVSGDGVILHANPASRPLLEKWRSGEGRPVPEDVAAQVDEARRSGDNQTMDLAAAERVYSFVVAPVRGEDYVNLYGRDVTEHRELEKQFLQTQKMEAIGTLAGGIAHDFNNLLQGILGYANLLKIQFADNEKVFKAADVIERASTRAAELTQQLLGFARRGKLLDAPVDMHRAIGEIVAILTRTLDKRIMMKQQLTAEPSVAKGDPGQLQQVIMNLAVNARDAMPDGGKLTFETSVVERKGKAVDTLQGRCLLIRVSDTGVGMSPEVQERIFEPFFTTKPQGEGTGMGLAMAYGIVKNHGGTIEVKSEPGKGTSFDIFLPLAEKSARTTDTPMPEAILRGSSRILVVDDEETVREILTAMLTSLGHEVHCVSEGREAVEYYREHSKDVDLVVLDMSMPVMDGRECFEKLKRIDPDVKAILATGHALEGAAQKLMDEGVLRFIQKPFVMRELAQTVAKALGA